MAFSDDTIIEAWARCGGRCECQVSTHDHSVGRCPRKVNIGNRGRGGDGAWEAHHIKINSGDGLDNCEILCWSCHKKIQSGGVDWMPL